MDKCAQISHFFCEEFPQTKVTVDSVGNRSSVVRRNISEAELRPGGTVSGPVLMEVADVGLYVAILGEIGLVGLAVTTSLNINFLRKPNANNPIIGECRLMKVGKKLVVGEVWLFSEGNEHAVAHATGTYSIPAF